MANKDKVFAQVKDGVVFNIIVLNDEGLIPLFADGFDDLQRIDDLRIEPQISWEVDHRRLVFIDNEGQQEVIATKLATPAKGSKKYIPVDEVKADEVKTDVTNIEGVKK